jgi:hypothetical protein
MNRLLAAAAVITLALTGATAADAAKKPSPRAKVYNATLAPTSSSAYDAVTGKVQMVDNKKSDSARIQLKGLLNPGSVYTWSIFRVKGVGAACDPANAGETLSAFRYRDLKVNPAGNASATAKSKTFKAISTTRYAVSASNEDGVVVACGELKAKKPSKSKAKGKS